MQTQALPVSHSSDRIWCAQQAMAFARKLGFSEQDGWKIAIAVSELAANIARHAGSGTVTLRELNDGNRGIEVVAENSPDRKRKPYRHTSGRGLGAGLDAVRELMDSCSIDNQAPGQFTVLARKYLRQV